MYRWFVGTDLSSRRVGRSVSLAGQCLWSSVFPGYDSPDVGIPALGGTLIMVYVVGRLPFLFARHAISLRPQPPPYLNENSSVFGEEKKLWLCRTRSCYTLRE